MSRMTLAERLKVGQWMTENAENVATMTPRELGNEAFLATNIPISDGTAARLRKAVGIEAVKPEKQPKSPRMKLADRVAALEQVVDVIGKRVVALEGLVQ